jgi:ferredoxin--NADP+ reductase
VAQPLRVAIIGAGPAGIYTADTLGKSDTDCRVDLFDRLPAPFGLVRYGVAPDHPRIKQIVHALHRVLDQPDVRLFGNVAYGRDVHLAELREHYDAVVIATGCERDRELDIPGITLPGSYGAAEFVKWYDGHPDVPRDWKLDARAVGVIGAGNVALDVARELAKSAVDMLTTEIPDNVYRGLAANRATDVHVFARRGLAQAKFTPWSCVSSTTCPASKWWLIRPTWSSTRARWSRSGATSRPRWWSRRCRGGRCETIATCPGGCTCTSCAAR